MAEPTLIQVFGTGALQDATTITISKTDLETVGLTPVASNRAESILAAIVKLASNYLTETNFDSDIDQSITIVPNEDTLITRNNVRYRQASMTVEFSKPDQASVFSPMDY